MREISHPSARGADRSEPPLVYLDDVNDGPADALMPRIVYNTRGSEVSLTLRIDRGECIGFLRLHTEMGRISLHRDLDHKSRDDKDPD